ncbi:MAG: hypothetical protein J7K40_07995 [candidate division Zixibacteria bacterium]|nr:hypothetical protein [candidate division Zixibacteria bacterium]
MRDTNNQEESLVRKAYRWLSYIVASMFIVMGIGILTKILLPGPFLTYMQRLILGGVILVYGIARLIMLYVKGRKQNKPM